MMNNWIRCDGGGDALPPRDYPVLVHNDEHHHVAKLSTDSNDADDWLIYSEDHDEWVWFTGASNVYEWMELPKW